MVYINMDLDVCFGIHNMVTEQRCASRMNGDAYFMMFTSDSIPCHNDVRNEQLLYIWTCITISVIKRKNVSHAKGKTFFNKKKTCCKFMTKECNILKRSEM